MMTSPEALKIFWGNFTDADRTETRVYGFKKDLVFPAIRVMETEDCYFIELAVPGYDRTDIKLSIESEVLKVKGVKRRNSYFNIKGLFKKRSVCHAFSRNLLMPGDITEGNAWLDGDILNIQLHRGKNMIKTMNKEIIID